jgi:hypothetical protein
VRQIWYPSDTPAKVQSLLQWYEQTETVEAIYEKYQLTPQQLLAMIKATWVDKTRRFQAERNCVVDASSTISPRTAYLRD